MQKLRTILTRNSGENANASGAISMPSNSLEPEIGFQITIGTITTPNSSVGELAGGNENAIDSSIKSKTKIPELNVHLIAARHLPTLFGFKVVKGYQVKVKLFPGSKRLDSSIQTNSWPKFNENFRFSLAPDHKSSFKHSSQRLGKTVVGEHFTPEEILAGQFVVFTVYSLLELPPSSFNRLSKTYRSLRDKSSNLVQKIAEGSSGDKENSAANAEGQKAKRKSCDINPRDAMPPLTVSESRRNIGTVTCYLEPKLFKRDSRSGAYVTEELWLPIKDITVTVNKNPGGNTLSNAPKGVVELILEVRDSSCKIKDDDDTNSSLRRSSATPPTTPTKLQPTSSVSGMATNSSTSLQYSNDGGDKTNRRNSNGIVNYYNNNNNNATKNPQWNRLTAEVRRKMGLSNISKSMQQQNELTLRVTTARMRCSNKVKDELEANAGTVYVKTTVYDSGIYMDSWKTSNFYPSLSTKWDVGGESATISVPMRSLETLENISIITTLATKTKMGKKLVLGTVTVGVGACSATSRFGINANSNNNNNTDTGVQHMNQLRNTSVNQPIAMWHQYY